MVGQRRVLHGASSGRGVRLVQEALAELRYALGRADGVYGRRTEQAVREFQKQAGLPDDGVVGPRTIAALVEATGNRALANVRGPLHSSTTGQDVEQLQARLRALGYPVAVDGVFGPSTERAVLAVQKAAGIRDDGVVGPRTYAALDAAATVAPPAAQNVAQNVAPPAAGLTEHARRLLETAALVHGYESPWAVDLLAATTVLSEFGQDGPVVDRVGAAALSYFGDWPPEPGPLAGTVPPPRWLVDNATAIRDRVERGPGPVDVRHLLAAVIAGRGRRYVAAELRRRGAPPDLLRHALRAAIAEVRPDDADAWASVLADPPAGVPDDIAQPGEADGEPPADAPVDLSGGFSTDYVPAEPDEPLVDRLRVRVYVRMLALLVADPKTKVPLSIGLFGEWGSGKSHFMGLLRQEVKELSGKGAAFEQAVAQITFNAWHYSDTNLWASLADEIFEQLAGPAASAGAQDAARREQLRNELIETMQRRTELAAQTESAQNDVTRLRGEVQTAEVTRDDLRRAFVKTVAEDRNVKAALDDAVRELGLREADRDRFRELASEVRGARGEAVAAWRYFTGRPWGIASVALTVTCVVLLTLAPWFAGRLQQALGGLSAVSVLAAATTAAARLKQARAGLGKLRLAAETAERVERERAAAETDEAKELREAEARLDTLSVQLRETVARAGELGRELAELSAGHRLYRFVADRAASDQYRRHLGIVSTIRRDFEQLVELMKAWQAERDENARGEPPPYDRIVLYIDDLDRCSAEQVVEVLQAVHLLLAMDLFVVVVGVDPRWLLRALRRQYAGILGSGTERGSWTSTPDDYLEKIFNIPFALRDLTPDGYELLLSGLAGKVEHAAEPDSGGDPPAATDGGGDERQEEEPLREDAGSEMQTSFAAAEAPSVRPMTKPELDYLSKLAPFVRTPRAATRMFNVYRMLRSTKDLSSAGGFLRPDKTGEYQVVAQLLAVLTAYPRVLGQLLYAPRRDGAAGGLMCRTDVRSWQAFVRGLAVRDGRNEVLAAVDPADTAAWNDVAERLGSWAATLASDDPAPFRLWGPHVARFSFQPGAVARQ